MIIIPSANPSVSKDATGDDRNDNTHRHPLTRLARLSIKMNKERKAPGWEHACAPLGLKRTTFTGAECLLSVARYSTLGGRGTGGLTASLSDASTRDGGVMFG